MLCFPGLRPVFAPETAERNVTKRGERDKRLLILLQFFAERSRHTGEVVGSIPTAPTIDFLTTSAIGKSRQNAAGTRTNDSKTERKRRRTERAAGTLRVVRYRPVGPCQLLIGFYPPNGRISSH
jgi:hypothetical protein